MKIALLRGLALNKFEMQNYEPLMDTFDFIAYALPENQFDLSEISIPYKILHYPDGALLIEGVEEERMRLIPMGIDLRVKEKFDHLKIAEELKQVYQRSL